ncbi:MAG: beta-lactamase family protein [Chitinophagaceae bacterium]|jgi:CubicO group peptidase (beta-lactamase class C family)|nr:beta-lactamase family protein [Chitinophagaceae bacterium]OQY92432.1 MAG: serine hydrolase [Sphingobacteriales bacterium UTBCD1]
MLKKALIIFLPVLFFSGTLKAQSIQLNNTKRNPEVDYARLTRIDSVVNEYVNNHWIVGAVTIVVKDNQLIQYKGYGYADEATKKPMANNSIFRIMSQTKAIVSAGALILYEKGKFLLDEPIADFIPEFRHPKVIAKYNRADTTFTTMPADREITFRDLLTQTSGIGYPDIGNDSMKAIYAKAKIPSGLGYFNEDLLQKMKELAKLPLAFQPGTQWMYGLNSDLLGCLIEVISGINLEDYLRKELFDPLEMKDTYFNLPKEKFSRLATVYTEDASGKIIKWSHTFRNIDPDYPMMDKHYFSGGAGLSSTAFDYAIFLQMLLNSGIYNGKRILSPRTIELMTQNQINDLWLGPDKFGLGFEITTKKGAAIGARSEGSFSWGGYYGTNFWADPEKKLACLIMTQQTPKQHNDLSKKFEVAVYQSLKK